MAELERDARISVGQFATGQWWACVDGQPLLTNTTDTRHFKIGQTRYFETEREAVMAAKRIINDR
jgi:hypothetical protein